MRGMGTTGVLILAGLCLAAGGRRPGIGRRGAAGVDADHDGVSDALEQTLLHQFAPRFLVAREDCAGRPARFAPGSAAPRALAADGTIYGQVFPLAQPRGALEIHYYDLWARDCGAEGHALDAEHVAALVEPAAGGGWRAAYWYAAAHEDTVCDVSQIAAAEAVDAADQGPRIWISAGKHAAFLAPGRCARGCGHDVCSDAVPLSPPAMINLGEPGHPLHGAVWAAAAQWPLGTKMATSDFPPAVVAALPAGGITLFHPGRHPMQGVVAISSRTADDTTGALATGQGATGNGLGAGAAHALRALKKSAGAVARFLGLGGGGAGG